VELTYSAIFLRRIRRLSRRYRNFRNDIQPIIDALEAGETPGGQMMGVGYPIYKVRAANSDSQRGKSGGYRIIYYLVTEDRCLLLTIYTKTDQADVTAEEIRRILVEEGE